MQQAGEGAGSSESSQRKTADQAGPTATLRFRHSAAGSGLSRRGLIRPGGRLIVEYDPARLAPGADTLGSGVEIMCHVRFDPSGQVTNGPVLDPTTPGASAGSGGQMPATARHVPFEVAVPPDATRVELWFESRGPSGTLGWDSRYGQNYAFMVVDKGLPVPEPAVSPRPDARVDPSRIRVVEDAASKEATRSGGSGRRLRTELVIRARVEDAAADAWADIHVFDAAGELIHAGTVLLHQAESSDSGALLVWEDDIYQGSGGGSGVGVWSRPDAHTVQYRVYCKARQPVFETQGPIFTDGILHEFEVPADEDAERGEMARG